MTKCLYHTPHNHPKTKGQNLFFPFEERLIEMLDENGNPYLESVETIDTYALTQSHKDECDIENILKRAAMGDMSVFRQSEPTYMDATGLPKSLMEAQNLVNRMKYEFEQMPAEVKEKFGYNADRYVNTMGTKEFNNIMGEYNNKINAIKEAGSLKEYEKKVKEAAKFNKDVKAAEGGNE